MLKREKRPQGLARNWPQNRLLADQRYNKLVKPFLPNLRGMAFNLAKGSPIDPEDLVNEAIIKIIAASGSVRSDNSESFIKTVAHNAMITALRSENRHNQIFKNEPFETMVSLVDANHEASSTQHSEAEFKETVMKVRKALEKLRMETESKELFRYHTGLDDGIPKTYQMTAQYFDLPVNAVKSKLHAVRLRLRKKMAVRYQK